ncbi:uncharacterized protein CCR75_000118 [Bremia lactucae]|uniref:Uncharacterized protein n=1 Tax=Bremia lactucae TaxID=4779 RepID=A0A976NYE9_BRELC|nr:hypothetical protein CCR75_000118 [Bremia lactucae]
MTPNLLPYNELVRRMYASYALVHQNDLSWTYAERRVIRVLFEPLRASVRDPWNDPPDSLADSQHQTAADLNERLARLQDDYNRVHDTTESQASTIAGQLADITRLRQNKATDQTEAKSIQQQKLRDKNAKLVDSSLILQHS